MKQRRLTHKEKTELFAKYETGKYTGASLAKRYNISSVAVNALLRRHGYESQSQSELQRKYQINEHRFEKQVSLFVSRQKFYFQCQFHEANIQLFFLYQKIITIFVKQFNYGAVIPPIGSKADQ
jgi:DNA-binding MarR family transcriptional regulator